MQLDPFMFMDFLCKLLQSSGQGQNESMILGWTWFPSLEPHLCFASQSCPTCCSKVKLTLSVKFFCLSNPENQAVSTRDNVWEAIKDEDVGKGKGCSNGKRGREHTPGSVSPSARPSGIRSLAAIAGQTSGSV